MNQESTNIDALPKHLILYDGECGLCDHVVQFLLDKDKKQVLHYSPLQGNIAAEIIKENAELQKLDSILYVRTTTEQDKKNLDIFWHSSAVIEICKILPFPYSLMRFLFLCPKFIRDWGYRFIARHRLRFFGTVDTCRLPTPSERSRFL